ncbi:MAG: hypothetical protein ABIF85_04705 [Nanoarchaeota archaeon]|nr:hypothetical protein [Nanoarchaeota archaeon]MBU4300992.1 hypothetical protein [Nanoarchaeota archaeon]MBU4452443.1 hypothetical protein [Nanoarchaeota archaeon]MCG2723973.1 hypothetical protein [archaeon]
MTDIAENECAFKLFLIETNGMLLGEDKELAKELSSFGDYIHVRLSFKAGTPEAFEQKTGAEAKYFENQFRALEYLKKYGIPYNLAAMSKNPELMPDGERHNLFKRMAEYGLENFSRLDEEKADLFGITKKRLAESGIISKPENFGQMLYEPIKHSIFREVNKEGKAREVSEKELDELVKRSLDTSEFGLIESPCNTCTSKKPWHGHGAEDDLGGLLTYGY